MKSLTVLPFGRPVCVFGEYKIFTADIAAEVIPALSGAGIFGESCPVYRLQPSKLCQTVNQSFQNLSVMTVFTGLQIGDIPFASVVQTGSIGYFFIRAKFRADNQYSSHSKQQYQQYGNNCQFLFQNACPFTPARDLSYFKIQIQLIIVFPELNSSIHEARKRQSLRILQSLATTF